MSWITSHILDTAKGKPAQGVTIILSKQVGEDWAEIARGITNTDGRVSDFPNDVVKQPGTYKIKFETGAYFKKLAIPTFYPFVEIIFETTGEEHYHIPLLLNAFGYSTYRGS